MDTLAPYLFIIYIDNVLKTSIDHIKENGKKQTIPRKTITDADYADTIGLLVNTPTQVESLLLSLRQATGGSDLHVNADKTEYICFNKKGDISIQKGNHVVAKKFAQQPYDRAVKEGVRDQLLHITKLDILWQNCQNSWEKYQTSGRSESLAKLAMPRHYFGTSSRGPTATISDRPSLSCRASQLCHLVIPLHERSIKCLSR